MQNIVRLTEVCPKFTVSSWSPPPLRLVSCGTVASCFPSSRHYMPLQFCPFNLIQKRLSHLLSLGSGTHSLRACLFLYLFSNFVLSFLISLDIHLFLLMFRLLSSKLLFPRLPCGNPGEVSGEPNTLTRNLLLFTHFAFDVALSSTHFPTH